MAEIIEPTAAITEYDPIERGLAELRVRYECVTYPVETAKGLGDAIAGRAELRGLRLLLDSVRAEIKRAPLERCRAIDAEAKRIKAEIVALEGPIDAQIKAELARKAKVKAAKEDAERERIAAEERERLAAQQAEIDRQRAEVETARMEAEANAQAERERIADERRRAEETVRKWERLALERRAAEERERVERERADDEARADEERERRERREAEQRLLDAERAKQNAAARAERERLAAEERERLDVERARVAAEQDALRQERARVAAEQDALRQERARVAAKRQERELQERLAREQAEVEHATLLDAAVEVVSCFDAWGVIEELPARKLAAAVVRAGDRAP